MKILIIAPHADDEVIGCGGLIARRVAEGHIVDVAVTSVGPVLKPGNIEIRTETRRRELAEVSKALGVRRSSILIDGFENRLDIVPRIDIISGIEAILRSDSYDQVFFPLPSHHQDHRVVYEACFSALRPGAIPGTRGPSLVAMYEYPYTGWVPDGNTWGGRYYVDISHWMSSKLDVLSLYRSQLREGIHPVSLEAVKRLAQLRGIECGVDCAELFYVLRMIDG